MGWSGATLGTLGAGGVCCTLGAGVVAGTLGAGGVVTGTLGAGGTSCTRGAGGVGLVPVLGGTGEAGTARVSMKVGDGESVEVGVERQLLKSSLMLEMALSWLLQ